MLELQHIRERVLSNLTGINLRKLLKSLYVDKYKRYNKVQRLFILDGVSINASVVLTSGIFLSGYVVLLGGSDFLTALLNNSMAWASMAAIFCSLVFERMRKRKKVIVTLHFLARMLVCSIIFLPLILKNNNITLPILACMVIAGNILWSFFSIGSVVWMMDAVPQETRKDFIYDRMFWLRISFTITTIVMGFILDAFNKTYTGFFIVFVTSLVFSVTDTVILMNIEEGESQVNIDRKINFKNIFEPWGNKEYRKFLIFVFLFYVIIFSSVSYNPLYLIKYMNFDYKFISTITVISYIFMIVSTSYWKKAEWKRGIKYVLRMGALFIILEVLVYAFLTRRTYFLLYIAPVLSGIGNSGFNIAILNYRYDLMPENNKTIYEAWFTTIYGLGSMLAPIIGDYMITNIPLIKNILFEYSNFQLTYLITFLLNALVIFLFFGIKEKGGIIR